MDSTEKSFPMDGAHIYVPLEQRSLDPLKHTSHSAVPSEASPQRGALIINADDWGRDQQTTERIFECFRHGTISSVSAMVFMEDSERAAAISQEQGIDAGLHLNLTTAFSARSCPQKLKERQLEVAGFLRRHSFARVLSHPSLGRSFEYAVKAQIDEYSRIYGIEPERFDGHHHMHLSSNVLFRGLLPFGTIVRRHFSKEAGEKPLRNRLFRRFTDVLLSRRHRLVDFFFSLPPLDPPARLRRIFALACQFAVEVETHPANPEEYRFLSSGEVFRWAGNLLIARSFDFPTHASPSTDR
jgi:predicted glycoside hydrolase/deacetylase ChbG (UPF0249 family)